MKNIYLLCLFPLLVLVSCEKNNPVIQNSGIVGDTTKPAEITIINATYENISGAVNNVDVNKYKVVLWAKTDQWYIQPYIANPRTSINSDGTWSSYTHSYERIVALLVDNTYLPGSILQQHPASQAGVLAWDEKPTRSMDKTINWCGYQWLIKSAVGAGPGPNNFSDDTSCVKIDYQGRLHLKTVKLNGSWNCGEIFLNKSLGYGTYQYQVDSRVDSFDYNTVFSGFLYDDQTREIDIEFSRALASPYNIQYVVQPYNVNGNLIRFLMGSGSSTHQITWSPDSVVFRSWVGTSDQPLSNDAVIHTWTYSGNNVPIYTGNERFRFNLWLFNGNSPQSGLSDEVIIKKMTFKAN